VAVVDTQYCTATSSYLGALCRWHWWHSLRVKVAIMRIQNDLLSSMELGLEETHSGPSGAGRRGCDDGGGRKEKDMVQPP
jgi:hypothetical protein